jgi:aspartyl-tRNA(Asn)/glutamyl-tRNA(Gln) amidotransferase subunit A
MLAGHFTPSDLVDACFQNIQNNEHLNAYVTVKKYEDLMKEAEVADKRFKAGKSLGVLDGIPVSIKDNIFVKGMQASAASRALEGFIAPMHATTTLRLIN